MVGPTVRVSLPGRMPFSFAPGSVQAPPGLESSSVSAVDWQHMVESDPVHAQPGQAVRQQILKAQRSLEQALMELDL